MSALSGRKEPIMVGIEKLKVETLDAAARKFASLCIRGEMTENGESYKKLITRIEKRCVNVHIEIRDFKKENIYTGKEVVSAIDEASRAIYRLQKMFHFLDRNYSDSERYNMIIYTEKFIERVDYYVLSFNEIKKYLNEA